MKYDFLAKIGFIYAVKVEWNIIYRRKWDAFESQKRILLIIASVHQVHQVHYTGHTV